MIRFLKNLFHLAVAVFSCIRYGFPGRKLTVIAVTGTDGKTTTSSVIFSILRKAGIRASAITTVNAVIAGKEYDTGFHVTNPDSLAIQKYLRAAVDAGDTHVVLEMTSHGIDQHRVWGIPVAVAAITNVTHEHLDYHGTFEKYLATKMSLIAEAKTAIVNIDDPGIMEYMHTHPVSGKLVTYGLGKDADVNPSKFPFRCPLPGNYNVSNCLAAMAAAMEVGIRPDVARRAIEEFPGVVGRMNVLWEKPFRVIVDFAHTPNAIDRVLSTVRPLTKGKLIHVFGSAGLRDATKRPLMGEASGKYADVIILTEEDYRTESLHGIMDAISSGFPAGKTAMRIDIRGDAIRKALSLAKSGDTVIITGKGHERSLCRGTTEYPWSDIEETRKMLEEKVKETGKNV